MPREGKSYIHLSNNIIMIDPGVNAGVFNMGVYAHVLWYHKKKRKKHPASQV